MKRFSFVLLASLLLLLFSGVASARLDLLPPRTPEVEIECDGGDDYTTILGDLAYPGAMMFAKRSSNEEACYQSGSSGGIYENWVILGIQDKNTEVEREWWDPPNDGHWGCVKACVLVGWPPVEVCGYHGVQHHD